MGGDRKAGHNKEKKNNGEESKRSKAADLESDKKTTKEEDGGGPSMSTRGRKRKRGEDGPSQNNLPGDTEAGRKKRKEDESPVQKSSRRKRKEKDDGQSASESSSTNKEGENGNSVESSVIAPQSNPGPMVLDPQGSVQEKYTDLQEIGQGTYGQEQHELDTISQLPDIAQNKIFESLSLRDKVRVAQVCSFWRDAVYRPQHWRKLAPKVKLSKAIVSSFQSRQILRMKVTTLCKGLTKLLVEFSTLKQLKLSPRNTTILLKSMSEERFVSLLRLDLHITNKWQMQRLQQSLQCFPNLHDLTVHVDSGVATGLLEAIGNQLRNLDCLFLRNTKCEPRLNLEAVGQLKRLKHLYLYNFHLEGIEVLSELSSTLKDLTLGACDISDGWTPVLSQLGSLEKLTISHCLPVIDSDGLLLLAQTLPNLKKLGCGSASSSRLHLSEQEKMNDDHVIAVANMSGLQEVELHYGLMVTDAGVNVLCASLRNMRALTILGCNGISSEGVGRISGLSSLTVLRLENCNVGGNWLKVLAKGSCRLKKLDLADFADSAEDMEHLAQMSTLRDLGLRKVVVGATGLAHMSKATFHLEALEMVFCGVTMDDLNPLLQRQTSSLKKLILVERTGTPRATVPYLRSFLPHLEKCTVFNWNKKEFYWNDLYKQIYK